MSQAQHQTAPGAERRAPRSARSERLDWVRSFRKRVASDVDTLCGLVEADTGKARFETVTTDLMPLLASCRWHERHARRLLALKRATGGAWWLLGQSQRVTRAPLGTVGIIATWNYPLQLLGVQLVQALVAGNTVIVKPSEHAPRSQRRLLELAAADLPDGVLTWTDATREAGAELLDRNRSGEIHLDHLVFTGSTEVGRTIAETVGGTLTTSTLELSGRDSALVLGDADPSLAARSIWHAVTLNSGQTCMAPRRALIDRAAYPEFVRALSRPVAGSGTAQLIMPEAATHAFKLAADAVRDGGRSLSGVLESPQGAKMRPVAVVDCPPNAELVTGAHFGPVLAVIPCDGLDEMLAIHRACDQHLATSVYTRDKRRARELAPLLGSGSVTVNDTIIPTAHPGVSIHGHGRSGWGMSQGVEGLLALTRAVTVSSTNTVLRIPVGPPAHQAAQWMPKVARTAYGGARSPNQIEHTPTPARPATTEGTAHGH